MKEKLNGMGLSLFKVALTSALCLSGLFFNNTSYIFAAVFGVLLSVGIAVVWEIFEYGCDTFLYSDMQSDTVITAINTKINRTDGIAEGFAGITETLVNGESLGVNGYLDIGLIDTMEDMMIETAGALFFLIYVLFDKNAHPMIVTLPKEKISASKSK